MTKLLFVGDPHGVFEPIRQRVETDRPEAIILLGDQTPQEDGVLAGLNEIVPVFYLLGNHDTDPVHNPADPNPVYPYLRRHRQELPEHRHLNGRVTEIAGFRIAGLAGVFREKVWFPGKALRYRTRSECARDTPRNTRYEGGPPAKQWSSIWPEDFLALEGERADILVTHEAPESHRNGFQALGDLARSLGARAVIHGHHHEGYQAEIAGGIRVTGTEIPASAQYGLGIVSENSVLAPSGQTG